MASDDHAQSTKLGLDLLDSDLSIQLTVGGESMFPFILPRDQIVVSRIPFSEIEVGNVIVFKRSGGWVAHRVVSVAGKVITKGDSCISLDDPVTEDDFVGRVSEVIQGDEKENLETDYAKRRAKRIASWSSIMKYPYHLANKVARRFR